MHRFFKKLFAIVLVASLCISVPTYADNEGMLIDGVDPETEGYISFESVQISDTEVVLDIGEKKTVRVIPTPANADAFCENLTITNKDNLHIEWDLLDIHLEGRNEGTSVFAFDVQDYFGHSVPVSFKVTVKPVTKLTVKSPTKSQILTRMKKVKDIKPKYVTKPNFKKPYSAGTLTKATLNNALATLNLAHYIAGIPDDVTLDERLTKYAQAASMVDFVNDELTHEPERPPGMDLSLYQMGADGAMCSNMAWAQGMKNGWSFYDTIMTGWLGDYGVGDVGHRRWSLDPSIKKVGFGEVWDNKKVYNALCYTDDWFNDYEYNEDDEDISDDDISDVDDAQKDYEDTEYRGVAWPARNMPLSLFDPNYAWSVCLAIQASDDTTVTLIRRSDKKKWMFSKKQDNLLIENHTNYEYCGQNGALIFHPDGIKAYKDGDVFDVAIRGRGIDAKYTVNFFLEMSQKEKNAAIKKVKSYKAKLGRVFAFGNIISMETKQAKISDVKYQMQYKKGKKGKWKAVKGKYAHEASGSAVIEHLASKKTYYVRSRIYKDIGGYTYYGKWSTPKKVKTN